MNRLLAAVWQADSAFPSGSFAFSNGIEGMVAREGRIDRARLSEVLAMVLRHRWATADRHAVVAGYRAAPDTAAVCAIDALYEASTIIEPLRAGSRRNGLAFLTAHARIGTQGAKLLRAEVADGRTPGHLPVVQGFVWWGCGLDEEGAVGASGYTTASSIVSAMVRLGSIGAVDAQASLAAALPVIAELAGVDSGRETEGLPIFASMTPWLDIAATRHMRAEVRLFAN